MKFPFHIILLHRKCCFLFDHLFLGSIPSSARFNRITYFAPNQKENMAALQAKGVEAEPLNMPGTDNHHFIIPTPEGQQFFLFSLNMPTQFRITT